MKINADEVWGHFQKKVQSVFYATFCFLLEVCHLCSLSDAIVCLAKKIGGILAPAKCVLPVGHAISVKKNVNCETGEWSHKAKEPGEMGETARIQKLLQTLISDQTVQHHRLFLRLHIKHTMYLETDEHCYSCSLTNDPRSYNFSILINHLLNWFRQEIVVSGETGEVCSRGWEAERISHVTPVTFTK